METVQVTPENYVRAETDRNFQNFLGLTGGVNRFFHVRKPTPLDQQPVIRMNLDTLYSGAVVDTAKGATVTLPEVPPGRFISAQVIDNDHYCPATFYEAGPHRIESDTRYAAIVVRIQVFDPRDPAEIALVNALQDRVALQAGSAEPFPAPRWESRSLQALTERYNEEARALSGFKGLMGRRGKVDDARRHLVAAAGWGLNPDEDATYFMYAGKHDPAKGHTATYRVPENRAFWSITVYGEDGYMKSENAILNSSTVKLDPDGKTFRVHFGSKELCGDVPNRLDAPPGWNFVMRVYRPGRSVLDGSYVLPPAWPVG
ncbi:MAG TPA: DUF1254 domain-containing protein [Thermoanaerobaculia bacterium]|nr:DUF1254 domain-containing protein [Thermoanaerobaculia bacterium]